ncbi:MAG TPA: PAS domain-containing sensor histidine kinase [Usitatibacter sp.]|nr:PAS domain-containing sensor histidine kinase [Usitatibacter sp.]
MDSILTGEVERQLRLVTDFANDHAFMLLDTRGGVTWWSKGAENIFGYASGEIVGRNFAVLFPPEDIESGVPEFERLVSVSDGPAEDDRWMRRKDGSVFWASGILVRLQEDSGELIGFGKILRNRTDVKEQLETLRNLARELEASGKRKDTFLGMLSHELRNPMAPIANALGIIRASVPEVTTEIGYALKVIERQMSLLDRLVEDLLDLTRVGAGKVELRLEPVVLQELAQECMEDVAELMRQRRHKLEIIGLGGAVVVNADRDRMHQVVVNLLVNAAKYTPEGGNIWVKVNSEGKEGVLKVGDNGVGIPTDMLPQIFDLFTQVESTRSASRGGLGIGLSLVKNLVGLHDGTVQVRSEGPGKGSEFTVRLPLLIQGG